MTITNRTWKSRLKRALKKLSFLLSFNLRRWRVASILRSLSKRQRRLSFNDTIGLHGCIHDVESDRKTRAPVRSRSWGSDGGGGDGDGDIDRKAEIFISNFRRQLLMERQVSLQLRYYRGNSFTRDY